MSEQGWQSFLGAEGVDDWVVVHGGATAAYRVASLGAAARLAETIAHAPGVAGQGVLVTLGDDRVTVRASRDLWSLEDRHVDLARAVSAVASEHGAVADRGAVREVQLAIAAKPDQIDVGFWRTVLGYAPMAPDNAVDPLGHSSTVWMQEIKRSRWRRLAWVDRHAARSTRSCTSWRSTADGAPKAGAAGVG
jgi:4a-hydroxytetrahydrobiopterin dehydratase